MSGKTVNLDDIETGFDADAAANEMAGQPKQRFEETLKIGDLSEETATGNSATGTGDSKPGPLSATRLKDHAHARQNAEIVVMLIGFVVAFALIYLVDKLGKISDYNFTESEREIGVQGFETWFKTFEEDFVVPGFLAALVPLIAMIYLKYEQAATAAKERQPLPPPPPAPKADYTAFHEVTQQQTAPVPPVTNNQQPATSNQQPATKTQQPKANASAAAKPSTKKATTGKTSKP
jgi:hypothetical protein